MSAPKKFDVEAELQNQFKKDLVTQLKKHGFKEWKLEFEEYTDAKRTFNYLRLSIERSKRDPNTGFSESVKLNDKVNGALFPLREKWVWENGAYHGPCAVDKLLDEKIISNHHFYDIRYNWEWVKRQHGTMLGHNININGYYIKMLQYLSFPHPDWYYSYNWYYFPKEGDIYLSNFSAQRVFRATRQYIQEFDHSYPYIFIPMRDSLISCLLKDSEKHVSVLTSNEGRYFVEGRKYTSREEVIKAYEQYLETQHISVHFNSEVCLFFKFFMKELFSVTWDKKHEKWYRTKIYQINKHLSVRNRNGQISVYVNDKKFRQCTYLLFNLDTNKLEEYDRINSIDEMKSIYSNDNEAGKVRIDTDTEFWGHCSNLQAWYENDYDTRILEMRLAFPLLKKLTEAGDSQARKVFKEEVARRFQSGFRPVQEYLMMEGYTDVLTNEEQKSIGLLGDDILGPYKRAIKKHCADSSVKKMIQELHLTYLEEERYDAEIRVPVLLLKNGTYLNLSHRALIELGYKHLLGLLHPYKDEIVEQFQTDVIIRLLRHLIEIPHSEGEDFLKGLKLKRCEYLTMKKEYCPNFHPKFCGVEFVCFCQDTCSLCNKPYCAHTQCKVDLVHFREVTGKHFVNPYKQKRWEKQEELRSFHKPDNTLTLDYFMQKKEAH
ncbi:MAG: hypothetical protein R6U96_04710 [Promethearchaeia archaeon]